MNDDSRPRRSKSAFAAAFLSFLFPGLGQAYAGRLVRALLWAALPFLAIAAIGGLALQRRDDLLAFVIEPSVLTAFLVVNAIALIYRLVSVVDAWRVARAADHEDEEDPYAAAGVSRRRGAGGFRAAGMASVAGLLAVALVLTGGHGVVAYYDAKAVDLVGALSNSGGDNGGASESPDPSASAATAATPTPLPDWDGKSRLNILLIGADQRPQQSTFNTDTMIVLSVDPATKQAVMFSLPRDTVDVPLPNIPARSVYGTKYSGKINGLWVAAHNRPNLFPGGGYATLKSTLGYLYGLDIQYYVQVNFDGFKTMIDALGGVTINVQTPVTDESYPGEGSGHLRVYIPSGIQHMTGAQALVYARSRHGSSDFDRAQRQQRVIVSLLAQTDFSNIITHLDALIASVKQTVQTDIPVSDFPKLASLARGVTISNIRSYVFDPPFYQSVGSNDPRGYVIIPNVTRIRAAVKAAIAGDAQATAAREALIAESADVWVLNGTTTQGKASNIADYLANLGIAASAPNQKPAASTVTKIVAYNGAETKMPQTLALLQSTFGVTATVVVDPTVTVDFIVTAGTATPALTPPPAP